MPSTQRWFLETDGHTHMVEISDAGLGRRIVWRRDGQQLASKQAGDERVQLLSDTEVFAGAEAVGLRFGWVGPARRVSWYAASSREEALAAAALGVGGVDFVPELGSKAAEREAWIRAHPRLYTARQTAIAVGGVVGGLLVAWLLARVVVAIDLPAWDLPRMPLPDLPDIPWPDIRLPDWRLPGWVREVADKAKFVLPVLIAFAMARGEIRRRRKQDARRADREVGPDVP